VNVESRQARSLPERNLIVRLKGMERRNPAGWLNPWWSRRALRIDLVDTRSRISASRSRFIRSEVTVGPGGQTRWLDHRTGKPADAIPDARLGNRGGAELTRASLLERDRPGA
jgi:hypothetical protein